jgi:hypothetical protein
MQKTCLNCKSFDKRTGSCKRIDLGALNVVYLHITNKAEKCLGYKLKKSK